MCLLLAEWEVIVDKFKEKCRKYTTSTADDCGILEIDITKLQSICGFDLNALLSPSECT